MRHPGAEARGFRADGGGAGLHGLGPDGDAAGQPGPPGVPPPRRAGQDPGDGQAPGQGRAARDPADPEVPRLPPGQYVQASMPVLHYGPVPACNPQTWRSEEHTSELQSQFHLVCRLLLEKKKKNIIDYKIKKKTKKNIKRKIKIRIK